MFVYIFIIPFSDLGFLPSEESQHASHWCSRSFQERKRRPWGCRRAHPPRLRLAGDQAPRPPSERGLQLRHPGRVLPLLALPSVRGQLYTRKNTWEKLGTFSSALTAPGDGDEQRADPCSGGVLPGRWGTDVLLQGVLPVPASAARSDIARSESRVCHLLWVVGQWASCVA